MPIVPYMGTDRSEAWKVSVITLAQSRRWGFA